MGSSRDPPLKTCICRQENLGPERLTCSQCNRKRMRQVPSFVSTALSFLSVEGTETQHADYTGELEDHWSFTQTHPGLPGKPLCARSSPQAQGRLPASAPLAPLSLTHARRMGRAGWGGGSLKQKANLCCAGSEFRKGSAVGPPERQKDSGNLIQPDGCRDGGGVRALPEPGGRCRDAPRWRAGGQGRPSSSPRALAPRDAAALPSAPPPLPSSPARAPPPLGRAPPPRPLPFLSFPALAPPPRWRRLWPNGRGARVRIRRPAPAAGRWEPIRVPGAARAADKGCGQPPAPQSRGWEERRVCEQRSQFPPSLCTSLSRPPALPPAACSPPR